MSQELRSETLTWLLDPADPGPRYLALRDLVGLSPDDPELTSARQAAHRSAPISTILDAVHSEGYWDNPVNIYSPKYTATVWALILLAELGAQVELDSRIATGSAYLMDHALTSQGQFTTTGSPSGTADCLQGNLCGSLTALGIDDPRLESAYDWMARSVTGEGIAPSEDRHASPRYYAGKCGPLFRCGANNRLSCAWGGVKVMQAFALLPPEKHTPQIRRAIEQGAEFFLAADPATAAYPSGYAEKPSGNWWKFGFPLFYVSDILEIVEVLAALGYGGDPRLANGLKLVQSKQDSQGRWALEYDYAGKTYGDYGPKKQPNKWVTLRALRALSRAPQEKTGPVLVMV